MWGASLLLVAGVWAESSRPNLIVSVLGFLCLVFVPALVIDAAVDEVERRKAGRL